MDEVLVVDDGSEDNTSRVASMAMATLLSHRKNLGKGAAIRPAFDYKRRNGHEVLVLLDGDGQHDSDDIPALMKPVLDGEAVYCFGCGRDLAEGAALTVRVERAKRSPRRRTSGTGTRFPPWAPNPWPLAGPAPTVGQPWNPRQESVPNAPAR